MMVVVRVEKLVEEGEREYEGESMKVRVKGLG